MLNLLVKNQVHAAIKFIQSSLQSALQRIASSTLNTVIKTLFFRILHLQLLLQNTKGPLVEEYYPINQISIYTY